MKNPSLYKLFRKYNRKYFSNLLPEDLSFFYENLGSDYHGYCEPWNYTVTIHNNLSKEQVRGTVIHELIHCFEYLIEDKAYENEDEYHSIEFYFLAEKLSQLSGYEIA